MNKDILTLCLITHKKAMPLAQYKEFILKTIQGGITALQLREKSLSPTELYQMARELKILLQDFHIPLIINDQVELALAVDADGVHLGQSDVTPDEARKKLGNDKIIGWSIETIEQLEIANQLSSIDYVAASSVFPSPTKLDIKTIWGLAGLHNITTLSKHPVIAIGGINEHNVKDVIAHGARGVAVINAIHASLHPRETTAQLIAEINQARGK